MPPPRRRPATPPTRRPKVAGLHRRTDQDELPGTAETVAAEPVPADADAAETYNTETYAAETTETYDAETYDAAETPDLDVPVIGEEPKPEPVSNGRPTPSAKRRDSGTVVADRTGIDEPKHRKQDPVAPAPEQDEEPGSDADSRALDAETAEEEAPQPPNLTLPIALVVVALLLGGLAYWFAQQLSDARVGSGNAALSDVNATKDVVGAAQQAVTNVLSYKFDDMQSSTARAKEYLDGEAVGQYEASMKALEKEIQDQKLQVVVNPVSVGVVRMAGDDARVLVFADQIGARADKQPSGGPTQFAMDMHRTGGKWKIVKLDFFENR